MKKKKLLIFTTIMTTLSLLIAGCSSSTTSSSEKEEDKKVTLKLASYFADTSPIYTAVTKPWMERVTELTEGKVEFQYFPSEQLGKAQDLLKLTKDGVADISIYPANYFPDNMPYSHMIAGLPNLSETSNQGTLAYRDLLQESSTLLEKDYLNNGVRPVLTHVSPPNEIWTTGEEIRVPEDLKGLKVKTAGGITSEMYKFMGAVPVTISHGETYEALDKGVIQAANYYSMAVKSSGAEEILNYGVFPHVGSVIHGLVVNEKVWQGLSEDTQKAMIQAGEEIMESAGEIYKEETNKFNEEFVKNGGTIAELTKKEQEEWTKVTEEFNQSWLEKNKSDGHSYEEVLNLYKEKLEKYQ